MPADHGLPSQVWWMDGQGKVVGLEVQGAKVRRSRMIQLSYERIGKIVIIINVVIYVYYIY